MVESEIHLEWDPAKAAANRMKHGIAFELAGSVLLDPRAITIPDDVHSEVEERWITVGSASNGSLLTVVHTWHDPGSPPVRVRLISARSATRSESRAYQAGL